MSQRFEEMREKINADPERRRSIEEKKKAYMAILNLAEIRRNVGSTQSAVAGAMGVSQPSIAQIERGEDLKLSTLAAYVAALGARMEVNVVFPDHPEDNVKRKFDAL